MEDATVQGQCEPEFAEVRQAFQHNFQNGAESGAALVVYQGGRKVVDLIGGYRDEDQRQRWTVDTLVMPYSVCKPLVACATLVAADAGYLDLDEPVSAYWPEFQRASKSRITVRDVLDHVSGVPGWRAPTSLAELFDWPEVVRRIEAQAPWWPPRTAYSEQVLSYGHVLGELIQKVTRRSFAEFFQKSVTEPLGVEFWFGVPPANQVRCAELAVFSVADRKQYFADKLSEVFTNPEGLFDAAVVNSSAWRSACIPAVNGHGTADAVAKIYAALANGGRFGEARLFSDRLARSIWSNRRAVRDKASRSYKRIGQGFLDMGRGDFGSSGAGGSCGYGNHRRELGVAYLTRKLTLGFDREARVSDALHRVLQRRGSGAGQSLRRLFSFALSGRG